MSSLTIAREWTVERGGTWQIGMKSLWVNGLPSTPLATVQMYSEKPTLDETRPFSERIDDYFRSDLRIAWRKGRHSLSLDIQNVFNIKNKRPFGWEYKMEDEKWHHRNQAGIAPVLSWQYDW